VLKPLVIDKMRLPWTLSQAIHPQKSQLLSGSNNCKTPSKAR